MKLKRIVTDIAEVPETFRPFYEEKDGKQNLTIEIDGMVPAARLDEFRQTNIKDREAHEAEMAKYKDVDLDKYADLLAREKDLEDGKLVKRGDLEPIRKAAIAEAIKPFQEKEQKALANEARLKSQLADAVIGARVMQEGLKFGVLEGAVGDLKRRALDIFKLDEDGKPQAFMEDGKTPRYHQGDPLTIEQWLKDTSMAPDGAYMFKPNAGGGGDANKGFGGGEGSGELNPFDPKTLNRTLQGQLMQQDFAKAKRMAFKHGIVLAEPVSFKAA